MDFDFSNPNVLLEFIKILGDILPGIKSTVGLSNVSNGTPEELRGIINRTYLMMLKRYGLYSAIADPLDTEPMSLDQGKMPDVIEVIHKGMDEEQVDLSQLSQNQRDYVKTAQVLLGQTLYSHSWLED